MAHAQSREYTLRQALIVVFQETGAASIEIHSGDREPGQYIRRQDVIRDPPDDGTQNDPHERLS